METVHRDEMLVRSETLEALDIPDDGGRIGNGAIAHEYEVEPTRAERDVLEFVGEMKAAGLVEVPVPVAMA